MPADHDQTVRVEYVVICGWPDAPEDEDLPPEREVYTASTPDEARDVITRRKAVGVQPPHRVIKRTITETDVTEDVPDGE